MERKFEFATDEFYHIFNRGTEKRKIYLNVKDYNRFLALLYICNSDKSINIRDQFPKGLSSGEIKNFDRGEQLVAIGAYCLMPNHFHILIKEIVENGISRYMGKLSTAYSMYFNKKYTRTGKLFENKFKAEHADEDEYLEYLFAYIYLNPLKLIEPAWKEKGLHDIHKAKEYLKSYQYSSYPDYINVKSDEIPILNKSAFPEYFEGTKEFDDFIADMMQFPKGLSSGR
jgi:putative transposase